MKLNLHLYIRLFIACQLLMLHGIAQTKNTPDPSLDFFKQPSTPLKPKFTNLPVDQVKPDGWIKAIMQQDLTNGFVGKLDKLVPKIMKEDIYLTARRKSKTDIPNAGTQVMTGADWEISMQWWGGETQGNWWDGFIRNAFLTGDRKTIQRSHAFIQHILSSQDTDGYIGIYGKNLRYQQEGDNGELWAQTTLFRAMLAYYEFTHQEKVLKAVEKAMALTMSRYNEKAKSPFKASTDFGGLTHGLCITDICETLYRITGNSRYNEFAIYLYKEFSTYPNTRVYNDLRYEHLLYADSLFIGHSAHTYEHLRSLLLAYYNTGYPQMKKAWDISLKKLDYCILPGGAGIGDEWIAGRKANTDSCAAEFCGMVELRNFYSSALQKTGEVGFADKAELLTFNSMQGARFSDGKGITYCKTDNCTVLNKRSPLSGLKEEDLRFKYSPTHDDAAVCCNPNYGRDLPYYVNNMWMKTNDGLAAVLFGPSVLSTFLQGVPVKIRQVTNYPFSDKINFELITAKPLTFSIYIRKPLWSSAVKIENSGASIIEKEGFYVLTKNWKTGDQIQVSFQNDIKTVPTFTNEISLQRGPVVYAYNIPSRSENIRTYPVKGFNDFLVYPNDQSYKDLVLDKKDGINKYGFNYVTDTKKPANGFDSKIYLEGNMLNKSTNSYIPVKLVPMGSTILRKVTFPLAR